MKIVCYPISFNRWKAEFWSDDTLYSEAIGPRPGCAMRDVVNEFCLKYDGMPKGQVTMEITEWD